MSVRLVATLLPATVEEAEPILFQPPAGVDYLELRLDAMVRPVPEEVRRLLRLDRTLPVIATCRNIEQGGGFEGIEEDRRALLIAAAEAGADVIDVEEELIESLPAGLPGRRLLSAHLKRFMPRLDGVARRLLRHGADFTKLAVPADTARALAGLMELQEAFAGELGVVPTGRLAEAGRVMACARGATLTYAALDSEHPAHPDQPSLERLHGLLQAGTASSATHFFAVVGHPISHSLSPLYHNGIFRGVAKNARFVVLDVDSLADVLKHADALRLEGLAVTHPFKAEAVELADTSMPGAQLTGAANTLRTTGPGTGWQARNTDWKAATELLPRLLRGWAQSGGREDWFEASLRSALKSSHERRETPVPDEPPRVLLLGAGGAARAVAVALFEERLELGIWSRRKENATKLAELLGAEISAHAVAEPEQFPADMVINATPAGMPGVAPEGLLALSPEVFRPGGVAVDLTYGDGPSPFRDAASEAGVPLVRGETFFVLQAQAQAEVFTGASIPRPLRYELAERCGAQL